MKDYDVIVIGGGINGLTTACYLQKSGLSVGVFEARGQCGALCDTVELGLPGFLHNPHACMLVPGLSPPMTDLNLEDYGLDLRGTDVVFAVPHRDGTNTIQSLDPMETIASISQHSEKDGATLLKFLEYGAENAEEAIEVNGLMQFARPTMAIAERVAKFNDGLLKALDLPIDGDDLMRMTGYELIDVVYESEHVRTLPGAWGEFTGQWPINHRVAPTVLGLCGMAPVPAHQARGGSHALTHALVKCLVAHGGEIWTTCPVTKILMENGKAVGIKLSEHALLPGEEIRANTIVSNLTLTPTFRDLLGEEVIGPEWMRRIKFFNYDDPQLLAVHYALKEAPVFKSASSDPAIQRAWVGYFGCDTLDEIRTAQTQAMTGVVPTKTMGGWFIPTLADPAQAPADCHTILAWITIPPNPRSWDGQRLNGWDSWREGLGQSLADNMTTLFEEMAPGFGETVIERHVNSPRDQENSNPSAIRGNMIGGSAIPEQFGENRPLPGVCPTGASRSFIPNLYLSNSIHPFGATHLASGYIAAGEIAEDLGCRQQDWWDGKPFEWFFENMGRTSLNLGVDDRWKKPGGAQS
jgi:beta-carotene ketolase (CrtO type)